MSYSLKEQFRYLLKEEIDYSSKIATVYHLAGRRLEMYDPNWVTLKNKTVEDYHSEIEDRFSKKPKSRATDILKNAEKRSAYEEVEKYKGDKGKAYYIAKKIQGSLFDLGSYFEAGGGDAYGKGLYSCYRLNPSIARSYGPVITRFDVDISNFLIFNAGIAKKIYGENFRLQDQFMKILENKGVNLRGYYNQEVSLDISSDADRALKDYIEMLREMSEKPRFLNSDYDVDETTSRIASTALYSFSELFGKGYALKLRDIIDGIMFYGGTDGPVCVIYHPESLKTYKLTGAGYFDEDGNPVIEDDIEALRGKKSYSLKDSFSDALEIDSERAKEVSEERARNLKETLATFNSSAFNIDEHLKYIVQQLRIMLEEIGKNKITDIMLTRYENTPDSGLYFDNMHVAYNFAQLAPSILAEPFVEFAETFGQDLNTLSRKEFEQYCALLKSYQQNKNPSLSDFASYEVRCKANSEEEFSLLVRSSLGKILSKLNSLISEDITSDIETLAVCFSSFEDGSVSNSFVTFNIFDIELSIAGDKNILQQYFKSDSKMQNAVTSIHEYIDSIDDDSVKKLIKNSLLDSDITSEEGSIVVFDKYAGYWSDTHCMPPELIYSCLGYYFESTFENKNRSRISQYEIDRKIFDPFFILSLYGMEPSHAVEGEYCGSVKKMYKKGSEVMSIGIDYTSDYFKNFFLQEKADNLRDCMEFETDLMFGELGSRTQI